MSHGVAIVSDVRAISEVARAVVSLDAVVVADDQPIRSRPDESRCDKMMNLVRFGAAVQA
jgi:hypothetical protein